jgi:hypothetical protein
MWRHQSCLQPRGRSVIRRELGRNRFAPAALEMATLRRVNVNSKKRGPRSAADLAALSPVYVQPRQPLPPELSGDEAEVFLDVINSEEGGWFTRENLPLLVQYSRHIVSARRVAELLGNVVGLPSTSWEYYSALLVPISQRGRCIGTLDLRKSN